MDTLRISTKRSLSRRSFLRGAGVALGLPMLDAMMPAFTKAGAEAAAPRRFFAICNNLGVLPDKFFPAAGDTGRGYTLSPYLEPICAHRDHFTVFSGASHPDVDAGGHPADICFLTGAPHPGSGGFRNTISLDQYLAERIGHLTRFPSLTLGVNIQQGQRSLSFTSSGVMIPSDDKASEVFKRLFVTGSPEEVRAQMRRLELGQSVMDTVADQTNRLQRKVGTRDKQRLDQYLTGVREFEQRLNHSAAWEQKPKPVVSEKQPVDPTDARDYFEKTRLMYDMARLALETDSTRLIVLMLDAVSSPALKIGDQVLSDGYHGLSHHGKSAAKIKELELIDMTHMQLFDQLLKDLRSREEGGETLLDRTVLLYGSNMGDANKHLTSNLPTILAGGGFKHGQHIGYDRQRNYPLTNLFVSILQRFGFETDNFSSGSGTMRGLEMA